ncbi:MAG: hypothetical protein NTZ92_05355 [Candidatus Omnitrophica bacterium]|nr:hypothetical protein [Candidatus Omnitrophota bacterium]
MDIKRRLKKVERNMEIDDREENNEMFISTIAGLWKYILNSAQFESKEITVSPAVNEYIQEFIKKGEKWDEMLRKKGIKIEETKDK